LQILPFVILLTEMVDLEAHTIAPLKDLRNSLKESFRELFPDKNIYLGNYGKKIDFNIYFNPYYKDRKRECRECYFKNECDVNLVRDGKKIFGKYRKCPKELYIEQIENSLPPDIYDPSEVELEEQQRILDEQRPIIEQERREKIRLQEEKQTQFYQLISKSKFSEALEVLEEIEFNMVFKKDYSKILFDNLDDLNVIKIIFKFFFKSLDYIEQHHPESYIQLYKLLTQLLERNQRILENNLHNISRFFSSRLRYLFKKKENLEQLKTQLCVLAQKITHFVLKTNRFDEEWIRRYKSLAKIINILNDECKIPIRNIFRDKFSFDLNRNVDMQIYSLTNIFRNVDDNILRIIKNKRES